MSEIKKLYRSRTNKLLAGVCGGLGKYFKIDPVFIRIIFAVGIIWNFFTIIVYLLMWLIVPEEPSDENDKNDYININ